MPTSVFKKTCAAVLAVVYVAALSGCAEYMDRVDRVSLGAGDSMAANKVVHVVDPWPRDGFNTTPRTLGQRAITPVQRYNGQPVAAPSSPAGGGASSTVAAAGGVTTQ